MKSRYYTALFIIIALTLAALRYGPHIAATVKRAYQPTPERHVCPPNANCATVADGRACWHRRGSDSWECKP